ncbi:MAG: hypothetical protein NTW04_05340 [Elusimicrobia bacterium]|nr:hypothetical protein [Elusimicrobiota bacterium]
MILLIRAFVLTAFVYLAVKISVEDFKLSVIKNSRIVAGLKACAIALVAMMFVSLLQGALLYAGENTSSYVLSKVLSVMYFGMQEKLLPLFYLHYIIHGALTVLAGVAFWKFKIWPAGDAKLYIVFGLMLALIHPNTKNFPLHLFLVFLANTFILASAFFIAALAFKAGHKLAVMDKNGLLTRTKNAVSEKISAQMEKMRPNRARYFFMLANFFILSSISQSIRGYAHGFLSKNLGGEAAVFVILFLTWDKLCEALMKKSAAVVFLIFFGVYLAGGMLFFPERILGDLISGMGMMVKLGVLLITVKSVIKRYFETAEFTQVCSANLSPGMIINAQSLSLMRKDAGFYKDCFSYSYSDGLTAEQVEKLKAWGAGQNFRIARPKPFAVWISLGAVLTLLIEQDIIHFSMALDVGAVLRHITGGG